MRKLTLILLILSIAHYTSAQDYRVKKVTSSNSYVTTFNYSDDQLTSYAESGSGSSTITYSLKYDKNKVVITSDYDKDKDEIKFDKKGEIEKIRNIEFKYDKEGKKRWYKEKDLYKQWQNSYNLLHDEEGILKTIFRENDYLGNASLLFYNEEGKCIRMLQGAYDNEKRNTQTPKNYDNDLRAVWDGNKIISIEWKGEPELKVIRKHEFEYNENDLVVKEKVYKLNKETDKLELEDEISIEYESGKGNANLVYASYRNPTLNIAFGIVTYSFYKYIYM